MKYLLNYLLAPITAANRSDGYPIAPFTAANQLLYFNKIYRACHERKVGCLLFFAPPPQHAACLPTTSTALAEAFPRIYWLLECLEGGFWKTFWSCFRMNMKRHISFKNSYKTPRTNPLRVPSLRRSIASDLELPYMNLHQIPLEFRKVTAVKTTEPFVERSTAHGDMLLYHRISNFTKEVRRGLHMMHLRTRRG